ncbi:MAG: GntR family transcriptional regulator [Betaproteobacteria bacterium]|nr:GntR family transcriptional regulator [Betaproteobacteria bacterium]
MTTRPKVNRKAGSGIGARVGAGARPAVRSGRSGARREGDRPQYVVLARELMGAIESRGYPVGTLLPTEKVLCREFGMSRITVRAALRELEVRGLVSRRAGVGTRVETALVRNRFVHTANSVEDFLQALVKLTFRLLRHRTVVADADLAAEIGCAPGLSLLVIDSLRIDASGLPVCLSVHYIPEPYAGSVASMDGGSGSLGSFVARANGTEVAELRQVFDARNLDAKQAKLLKAKTGEAALVTGRWYFAPGNKLLMYSRSLFPKGRAIYDFRSRKEGLAPIGARVVPFREERAAKAAGAGE